MTLRESLKEYLPSWLNDQQPAGPSWGWRVLSTLARYVDTTTTNVMSAALSSVGKGTPSSLKYLGWARGIVRGRYDTDQQYAAKLRTWIDRNKEAGSQLRLAKELWEYLGGVSFVRIVNRTGQWVEIDTDGTIFETFESSGWDWDSISHPIRSDPSAPWWSDMWIIIAPDYPLRPLTLGDLTGDDGFGLGHLCPRHEVDAVKEIINRFKAAHSCVRAVLWTTNPDNYRPGSLGIMPDGTWGAWGMYSSGHYVASGRDLTETRYWEPR